jgi:DNA-binding MarR family transcriptional regulator
MAAQASKDAIRHQILTYLYEHEHETSYQSCDAEEIAEALRLSVGVVDPEVRALVRLDLADVKRASIGSRYVGVAISHLGQIAVEHPESMIDLGVRHVVYNTIHAHDNTTIAGLQMAGGASTQTVESITQILVVRQGYFERFLCLN